MPPSLAELEADLEKAKARNERVDALVALAWEVSTQNIARAMTIADEALALAQKEEDGQSYLAGEAKSLLLMGRLHTELGNFPESIKHLIQARPLFEALEDQHGMMRVFNEFGRVSYYLTDYPTALQYYLQEMELAQKLEDRERENATVYNVGLIHMYSDNFRMAMSDFNRALRSAEEIGDKRSQAFVHVGLSEAYLRQGDGEKSMYHAQRSKEISIQAEFHGVRNSYLLALGDAATFMEQLDVAQQYYDEATTVAELVGSRYDKAYTIAALGKLEKKRQNYERALTLLENARTEAEEIGSRDLVFECHLKISEIYAALGQFEKALYHYIQFHNTEKSLFNEKSDMKLRTLEVMHQVETSRRESEIYQLKNALLQQEIEERKKVQAMLEELVNIEPLTGLFNRRHFYDLAEQEFVRGKRYHHAFSVIMADIDHFKEINDRFGHAVGDHALVTVAGLIRRNLRAADMVCRYGGEEFAFLLPETPGELALQVAERIRSEIASYPFQNGNEPFQVTISMGVAQCPDECDTLDALFLHADRTLYEAKKLGRNQTLLFQPPIPAA